DPPVRERERPDRAALGNMDRRPVQLAAFYPGQAAPRRAAVRRCGGRVDARRPSPVHPGFPGDASRKARSAVMEVNFGQSPPFSLGIEEEFQLLSAESYELVSRFDEVYEAAGEHPRVKA